MEISYLERCLQDNSKSSEGEKNTRNETWKYPILKGAFKIGVNLQKERRTRKLAGLYLKRGRKTFRTSTLDTNPIKMQLKGSEYRDGK